LKPAPNRYILEKTVGFRAQSLNLGLQNQAVAIKRRNLIVKPTLRIPNPVARRRKAPELCK
jgi:hypothetical protein